MSNLTARCDGGAKVGLPRPGPIDPLASSLSATVKSQTRASSPTSSIHDDGLDAPTDDRTAPNTPPTPPSHLASPTLHATTVEDLPIPALTPAQVAARREQSDQASALIGQRLLQGWALLDAQCENETCFAVPLMRRPAHKPKVADAEASQKGSSSMTLAKLVDPRRYCVICHRDYLREGEVEEYERFMQATQGKAAPAPQNQQQQTSAAVVAREREINDRIEHSSAAKKRRFAAPKITSSSIAAAAAAAATESKGKQRAVDVQIEDEVRTKRSKQSALPPVASSASPANSGRLSAGPVAALERAIIALSTKLDDIAANEAGAPMPQWATDIANTAEALARTCKALESVRQLR